MGELIEVAFCADRNIRVGLHVTIYSMLDNLGEDTTVRLHVVTDSLTKEDFEALEETIARTGVDVKLRKYKVDVSQFQNLKWLTGWMTYTRLLLPRLIDVDKLIYLDSDLIFRTNIKSLWETNLENGVLGAVSRQKIVETNDSKFFSSQGRNLQKDYFNSGVLLYDMEKWRTHGLIDVCIGVANRFGAKLPSADQTVMNFVFGEDFVRLPTKYNLPVNPDRERVASHRVEDKIIHLIGFPKPWNFLGEYFNQQAHLYLDVLEKTALAGYRSYKDISKNTIYLTLRKSRAYAKSGKYMIKNAII